MKILLLYEFSPNLLEAVVSHLHKNHIEADSFDIVNWKFLSNSKDKLPVKIRILIPFLRIPRIHGLLLVLFQRNFILTLASRYNIIDIQHFGRAYDKVIAGTRAAFKKVKLSDLV